MRVSGVTMNYGGTVQGRSSPFDIPTKKLAMWLFILADGTTFAAFLLAYGFVRNGSLNWPTPFKLFPSIVNVMVMTFVLVSSSLTRLQLILAYQRVDITTMIFRMFAVAILEAGWP